MSVNIDQVLSSLASGDYRKATTECRKLIKKQGNSVESLSLMANIQEQQGKLEAAIDFYRRALAYADADLSGVLLNNIAFCHYRLGAIEQAIDAYRRALQKNPQLALSAFNLANLLLQSGQKDDAIHCFEMIFRSKDGEQKIAHQLEQKAYAALSRIPGYACSEQQISHLHELFDDRLASNEEGRAHCCFALANIYDGRQDYDQALSWYKKGNAIRATVNPYEKESDRRYVDTIVSGFDSSLLARCQLDSENTSAAQPVFILGMPRSGSTLVESILSGHEQVTALGEMPFASQAFLSIETEFAEMAPLLDKLEQLEARHLHHLRNSYQACIDHQHVNTAFYTDKMPENFACLGFILMAFPEARVIHIVRDPLAVLWSCFQTDFGSAHAFSTSVEGLLAYYGCYRKLMGHWQSLFSDRIYQLHYENLVNDTENEIARLMAYCGLTGEASELAAGNTDYRTATASLHQVREPVNRRALQKYKHYPEFVAVIEKALKE